MLLMVASMTGAERTLGSGGQDHGRALEAGILRNIFYDSETQAPRFFFLLFISSSGCLGFMNHPSIRAMMRIIAFDLGS